MTNYIVAFVLATIVYLIAIRYLQEFCPMSKFFKLVIYLCISAVSLPAVNYIHPPASGEDDIMSSLMKNISNTDNNMSGDWADAQQKANSLIHGGSSQDSQNSQESQSSDGIKTNTFSNDYKNNTEDNDQADDDSNYVIIGRNGKVVS